MEVILIRGWDLILPGWSWFHEPQPVSNQLVMELGLPHREGRYRPAGAPISPPVCWCFVWYDYFLVWGWNFILRWSRWLHEHKPINNQPEELEVSHRAR